MSQLFALIQHRGTERDTTRKTIVSEAHVFKILLTDTGESCLFKLSCDRCDIVQEDTASDITYKMSSPTLTKLLHDNDNPQYLFLSGQISITGNTALGLYFVPLFC